MVPKVVKCERCGKFRSSKDAQYIWHGDPCDMASGEVLECRWCMSPADEMNREEQE